ncbi:MAG: TorF family putative porin [Usitatibacter sp.]
MTRRAHALLLAGAAGLSLTAGVARAEDAPPSPFTGKVALYSEYEYRGIAQTSQDPALQLNLDYAHPGGLYIGTFVSNVKWLKDTAEFLGESTSAQIEWDIYGGYKYEFVKDWTLDVGYLRYEYPSSKAFPPATAKPNTDEVYAGVSWGPATLKYSYAFSTLFGTPGSKGSDYIELSVNQPIVDKLALTGVLGHQRYKGHQVPPGGGDFNNDNFSYTVWKLGAAYDFGKGFNAGAYYKGTNAESAFYTYRGKDWSKDRLVAFVSYSF